VSVKQLILALLLCLCLSAPAEAEEILLVADSWCPVNCEPGAERLGYVVDIARAVFIPLGDSVRYELRPWLRAKREVTDGTADGLIAATNEKGLAFPREIIGTLDNDYFTRRGDSWKYENPMSMSGKAIGTVAGYQYGDIEPLMKTSINAYALSGSNVTRRSLDMLLSKRVDVLVDWGPIIIYTARENGMSDKIRHAGRGGNSRKLYLAFTGDRRDLAEAWDKGVARLREDGTLTKILARYGLTPDDCGL